MSKKKKPVIYHFEPTTGRYLGSSQGRLDPIEGKPMVPAHATLSPVPDDKLKAFEALFWDGEKWIVSHDYRGEEYYDENGEKVVISEVHQEPEKGWSKEKPKPKKSDLVKAVKGHAAGLISASGHDWMALRSITTGVDVPDQIKAYAQAVRSAVDKLEKNPPEDFEDQKYWPDLPAV